jgi:recombination protein RecA
VLPGSPTTQAKRLSESSQVHRSEGSPPCGTGTCEPANLRTCEHLLSRQRRIRRALRLLEARFGPGVVRRLGEARPHWRAAAAPALSTGSLGLDLATGLGGYPRGQLTELFGPPSAGKTTLLSSALATAQRGCGLVALIDVPGMVDPEALAGCGVDLDALVLCQPADAVDALRALVLLAESAAPDLLALTSIADLRRCLPPESMGHARGASGPALALARLLSRSLRRLIRALRDAPTAVVVTNERLPGVPGGQGRRDNRSVGGLALRHFAALRVAVGPTGQANAPGAGPGALWACGRGMPARLAVVKHKLGPPGGTADVELVYGRGVDRAGELLALGLARGVIERCGLGLVFGREPLGKGEAQARRRLAENEDLVQQLTEAIRLAAGQRALVAPPGTSPDRDKAIPAPHPGTQRLPQEPVAR